MENTARSAQSIDLSFNSRVRDQWWRMVFLGSGIDYQWAGAAPVLAHVGCADAVYIRSGIRFDKGDPENVIQGSGGEFTVIDNHHQGKGSERMALTELATEILNNRIRAIGASGAPGAANGQNPRQADTWLSESARQRKVTW